MTRLYFNLSIERKTYELNKYYTHYLKVVLRKKVGDIINVFNENDGEWRACIQSISKNGLSVEVNDFISSPVVLKKRWIVFSLLKNSAMSFLAEKLTELGVTDIQPIVTDYTQVHKFSEDRFKKQMIDAAQQCERFDIPTLHPLLKLDNFLKNPPVLVKFYTALERFSFHTGTVLENSSESLGFIIGPEGGFSPREKVLLDQYSDIKKISLGPLVLKAETAAMVCLSKF